MTVHVVLDLETLAKKPDALITSVGAVAFKEGHTSDQFDHEFDMAVDFENCRDAEDFRIDPATVIWWLQQSDTARAALAGGTHELIDVVGHFITWFERVAEEYDVDLQDIRVWGNGPNFDISIFEHTFDKMFVEIPWRYSSVRCIRTVMEDFGVNWHDYRDEETAHEAIADARAEALGLIEALERRREFASAFPS